MTRTAAQMFPTIGDGSLIEADPRFHLEELQLAFRNKAIPLEGLRYDVTPTGMHYTLIHYDIPSVDPATWRLEVDGTVARPLSIALESLKAIPAKTIRVTIECAGDGRALARPRSLSQPWLTGAVGTAEWHGVPLASVLEQAELLDDTQQIVFTGLDRGFEGGEEQNYQRSLDLTSALDDDVILAWQMNEQPLEPQHGFPVRLVVPGWYGMAHVKWLTRIEAIPGTFQGYQQTAYVFSQEREAEGLPVSLMRVRSLMVPPGIPDFATRTRVVRPGSIPIEGRAWAGRSPIAHVQFSSDGGSTWADASVDPAPAPYAWQRWTYPWAADRPGSYELVCKAQDDEGNVQPVDQYWTARGMGNNQAHRVRVEVV